ncbi:phosphoenolpyruvate--protein phosphotransferase [Corallincola holothuriorum]|uniref:phosphoenolpyruvate--protein phosphotransferase n=1 Tax=Corallincola holothuriorum TaxID=2282215 RepID=A0A368NJJ3_9GAMM|nr:phosphoenolpyruvate--protein phosphotransferase [Corallincola holothuriorum]RCU49804.1 phosphoenolpyruvate--protein phosphotransferase [Corallincola holothuriorum]
MAIAQHAQIQRQTSSQSVILQAPLKGMIYDLSEVPDPVFAQKMVGDGISIDPTSDTLCAPCAGEVIQLHPSHHAITIRTAEGIEILMHIGLDTVMLRGEGFTPHVSEGDKVSTGQPLIHFCADQVALNARSLMTEIIITNGELVEKQIPASGRVDGPKDTLLELVLKQVDEQAAKTSQPNYPLLSSQPVLIPNPTGLHARPSATLAKLAKESGCDLFLECNDSQVNAKSVVALMGLNVPFGASVILHAAGANAEATLQQITQAIREGLGEDVQQSQNEEVAEPEETSLLLPKQQQDDLLEGVAASPGLAIGEIFVIQPERFDIKETANNSADEADQLNQAISTATQQLATLAQTWIDKGDAERAKIFQAHQELLSDPTLLEAAEVTITAGKSAAFAWQKTIEQQALVFSQMDNQLLRERATDLRDVGNRVLRIMLNLPAQGPELPNNSILIADDLTPSDTANLDKEKVVGFATVQGGSSSHVAIIARAMGLPAIAGIDPRAMQQANGTQVVLDGQSGQLKLNVSAAALKEITNRQQAADSRRQHARLNAHQAAITSDGHQLEVVANIGGIKDASQSVTMGGEGVGLLRSEFLYLDRVTEPTEQEQYEIYRDVLLELGPERPLIVRTLDVGGDKPLNYLPLPSEENPFLGLRGIRIGLDRPTLLRKQVRAILRASAHGRIRIMFPMIATLNELKLAKQVVEEERIKLDVAPIEIGIMVEVPSTAVLAEQFAPEVDFFSIGSNDLSQYTLAMDRGHPKLAAFVDGLNPAVLSLIKMTADAAKRHGKWAGVCGGIASDPQAVPLLIGLGVHELSVSVPVLAEIKSQIRELTLTQCQELAAKALQLTDAKEVRALVPTVD